LNGNRRGGGNGSNTAHITSQLPAVSMLLHRCSDFVRILAVALPLSLSFLLVLSELSVRMRVNLSRADLKIVVVNHWLLLDDIGADIPARSNRTHTDK
jgi:hypothetical protein